MLKIITLLITSLLFSQSLEFQGELQVRLNYAQSEKEFERQSINQLKNQIIDAAIVAIEKDYGLMIDAIDLNLKLLIKNDLNSKQLFSRFLLKKNSFIKEKLYLGGSIFIDMRLLVNKIKLIYESEKDRVTYDEEKLKFEISEIMKFRDDVYTKKKSNSAALKDVLKVGLTQQEVFNIMLYLNERRLELDSRNSILSEDKKRRIYNIKNSYITIEIDTENKVLTKILDHTPVYK